MIGILECFALQRDSSLSCVAVRRGFDRTARATSTVPTPVVRAPAARRVPPAEPATIVLPVSISMSSLRARTRLGVSADRQSRSREV